jgi:glycosyltransferase involved in cell wall biosynthesis
MAPNEPLISVIMPSYNTAAHIGEAARSALTQTYRNVELLFVDDGSTDDSAKIAVAWGVEYPTRPKVLHTSRVGPYPARNVALRRAGGELVVFLDADDWWDASALQKLHAALTASKADIAYYGWQHVSIGVESDPYLPSEYEKEDLVAHFLRACPGQSMPD